MTYRFCLPAANNIFQQFPILNPYYLKTTNYQQFHFLFAIHFYSENTQHSFFTYDDETNLQIAINQSGPFGLIWQQWRGSKVTISHFVVRDVSGNFCCIPVKWREFLKRFFGFLNFSRLQILHCFVAKFNA